MASLLQKGENSHVGTRKEFEKNSDGRPTKPNTLKMGSKRPLHDDSSCGRFLYKSCSLDGSEDYVIEVNGAKYCRKNGGFDGGKAATKVK
jgi:hypothetical protein